MECLQALSLFSGMGGDTLGMENAGVEVIAFSECDKRAIQELLLQLRVKGDVH